MCHMQLDEQLYRNYNELYSLILHCYKDVSMLDGYMELQTKQIELYNLVPNISNHIVRLIQKDLALTIWAIYFDSDKKANTIPRFRNSINKILQNLGNENMMVKKEKLDVDFTSKFMLSRNQFLAHIDMTRNDSWIEISNLKGVLYTISKEFNKVCNVVDDERISGISDIDIGMQDMICRIELSALYSKESN